MTDQYKRALRACTDGALKMTKSGDYEIFCYTQDTFWAKDGWNDLTKSHRGALYHKGKQVNRPFMKIFNLDEVPETELALVQDRMLNEDYRVMHKANGHLFTVSAFLDDAGEQHVVFHTKGGLPGPENDLLNDDILIFAHLYAEQMDRVVSAFPNSTWMFEAIVAHDKHTLYDKEVEKFGSENCFVLLGASVKVEAWEEMPYDGLTDMAEFIGCPVIHEFNDMEGSPDEWLGHSGTEGYVIHFLSDNHRVKIKTKEYWGIRFKKDLTPEKILSMFKKSGDGKIQTKLPEEVADEILFVLNASFQSWWYNVHVDMPSIGGAIFAVMEKPLTKEERAEMFKNDALTMPQKQTIASVSDGKRPVELIWKSKSLREKFYDWMIEDKAHLEPFEEALVEIVDSMGKDDYNENYGAYTIV